MKLTGAHDDNMLCPLLNRRRSHRLLTLRRVHRRLEKSYTVNLVTNSFKLETRRANRHQRKKFARNTVEVGRRYGKAQQEKQSVWVWHPFPRNRTSPAVCALGESHLHRDGSYPA